MTRLLAAVGTAALLALLSLVACSGGGGGTSSDAGASCSSAKDCPVYACACPNGASGSNAACANGTCADAESACEDIGCHAASAGTGPSGGPMPLEAGSPTTLEGGTPTPPGGGAMVYCSNADPNTCACGHSADYGTSTASCSEASLGSSAVCCGTPGWPGQGTCACSKTACQQSAYDTCICGAYTADGTPVVGSCTGKTCCKTSGALGQEWCVCWTDVDACPNAGDVQVGSCGVADVGCESSAATFSACH